MKRVEFGERPSAGPIDRPATRIEGARGRLAVANSQRAMPVGHCHPLASKTPLPDARRRASGRG
jgi:hypothetical protein